MADFPTAWWSGLPIDNPRVEDKRGHFLEEMADPFYALMGANYTPNERVANAFGTDAVPPITVTLASSRPGDPLQKALGYDDLLKYPANAVKPVVMSLREAQRKAPKKSSGGK